eukprot:8828138-Pyramimonas_sp.AAC.1
MPLLCVDADASFDSDRAPSTAIGPYTAGITSWTSDGFKELVVGGNFILSTAWSEPMMGSCTCFYDGKYEPRQIDFVGVWGQFARGSCDCQPRQCE